MAKSVQAPSQSQVGGSAAGRALTGRSIILGVASKGPDSSAGGVGAFRAINPANGNELATVFHDATAEEVNTAVRQAWQAFHELVERPAAERVAMLERAAQLITDLGDQLIQTAHEETGLPPSRLVSERERTTFALRLFADLVRKGEWVQATIDTGEPSRRPAPKPDLRRMLRALGPVAVFGAGNFPLAYSTAGGDTASALAAGCPVIVKGHPSHPGTGELVAQCVAQAVREAGLPPGTFAFLHAGGQRERQIGEELVQHRGVRAVGFTGSFGGGMALARLGASRPDPIPVFAEMGSTNPVFVLPGALETQGEAIGERLYASATNANGQMCTCPGLVFMVRGNDTEGLLKTMSESMNKAEPQPMLSARMRATLARRIGEVSSVKGVDVRAGSVQAAHRDSGDGSHSKGSPILASPALFRTNFETFKRNPVLHEEIFGPAAIVVMCESEGQLMEAAGLIQGSLTGTIWAGGPDIVLAKQLERILEQRVGRLIFNGVPTGVEVCAAMVHGGPYPATNQAWSTAVGPYAILRWCRPVCYQNAPEALLPMELRNANVAGIRRLVNGEWTTEGVRR